MLQHKRPEAFPKTKTGICPQLSEAADELLQNARKSFYLGEDPVKAGRLCRTLISRFPLTEQADYAKLLLHDISVEQKRRPPERKTLSLYPAPQPHIPARNPRIPLAIAMVALPIIGLAQGGVVGIGVPEILALVAAECALQAAARIRALLADLLQKKPEITFSRVVSASRRIS